MYSKSKKDFRKEFSDLILAGVHVLNKFVLEKKQKSTKTLNKTPLEFHQNELLNVFQR